MLKSSNYKKSQGENLGTSIHTLSYRLLNNHVGFLYPRLHSLEKVLKQSRLPIPYEVYVCSMVFFSAIAGIIGLIAGVVISLVVNIQPAAFAFLLPIIAGSARWMSFPNLFRGCRYLKTRAP